MIMEVYFMASEVLLNELRSIEEELEKSNKKVTDENAFEYLAMQFFCYKIKNIKPKLYDIESSIQMVQMMVVLILYIMMMKSLRLC